MSLSVLPTVKLDGPASIPDQLRKLADDIERQKTARTCLVVVDNGDEGIDTWCYGHRPRKSDTVGLLEFAKFAVLDFTA